MLSLDFIFSANDLDAPSLNFSFVDAISIYGSGITALSGRAIARCAVAPSGILSSPIPVDAAAIGRVSACGRGVLFLGVSTLARGTISNNICRGVAYISTAHIGSIRYDANNPKSVFSQVSTSPGFGTQLFSSAVSRSQNQSVARLTSVVAPNQSSNVSKKNVTTQKDNIVFSVPLSGVYHRAERTDNRHVGTQSALVSKKSGLENNKQSQAIPLYLWVFSGLEQLSIRRSLVATALSYCADYVVMSSFRRYSEPPEQFRVPPSLNFDFSDSPIYPELNFSWDYDVAETIFPFNFQRGLRGWVGCSNSKLNSCGRPQEVLFYDAICPPFGRSVRVDPPRPAPAIDPNHQSVIIPRQSVYFMQHTLSVSLVNGTPIPVASVSLSLDADSFSWRMQADMRDLAALPLITQAIGQPPIELIVAINGYEWRVVIDKIQRTHEFASESIQIYGLGLTAYLAQPHIQPSSLTYGDALSMQQIADLLLPDDWTINWQAVSWLVPAYAYSHTQATPIKALANLVASFGAIVVPSKNSKSINIRPRYPVLPWDFSATEPDFYIPDAAIVATTFQSVLEPQADAIFVHGGDRGGILAHCRMTGTAGLKLASTVNNHLITSPIAARALAERIIAGQHTQPILSSAELPLSAEIPLLSVGDFCDFDLGGVHVRGGIGGVSIRASLASVRQSVQLGESVDNIWSAFSALIDREPVQVGRIVSAEAGSSVVAFFDGGTAVVRGVGAVGKNYFVRGGVVQSEAPDFQVIEIII